MAKGNAVKVLVSLDKMLHDNNRLTNSCSGMKILPIRKCCSVY